MPFLLTACFHRHHSVQNQQLAPPLSQSQRSSAVSTTPVELPPAATLIPPKPTQNAQASTERKLTPHSRHRRRAATPTKSTPEVAANEPPPTVSAIGQLSSGDPVDFRRQTEDSISAIEKGLNSIQHSLNSPQQKTADHIREFLKQARTALASGDVDGAATLAAKAKVLLAELSK
ncbi:MAG: hypothetical protein ACLGSH_17035 [Acidobacteriota bacterium]